MTHASQTQFRSIAVFVPQHDDDFSEADLEQLADFFSRYGDVILTSEPLSRFALFQTEAEAIAASLRVASDWAAEARIGVGGDFLEAWPPADFTLFWPHFRRTVKLAQSARAREVLVSEQVRRAVLGRGFAFDDRGEVGRNEALRAWAVRWE